MQFGRLFCELLFLYICFPDIYDQQLTLHIKLRFYLFIILLFFILFFFFGGGGGGGVGWGEGGGGGRVLFYLFFVRHDYKTSHKMPKCLTARKCQ